MVKFRPKGLRSMATIDLPVRETINQALDEEMERDGNVFLIGGCPPSLSYSHPALSVLIFDSLCFYLAVLLPRRGGSRRNTHCSRRENERHQDDHEFNGAVKIHRRIYYQARDGVPTGVRMRARQGHNKNRSGTGDTGDGR